MAFHLGLTTFPGLRVVAFIGASHTQHPLPWANRHLKSSRALDINYGLSLHVLRPLLVLLGSLALARIATDLIRSPAVRGAHPHSSRDQR